ATRTGAGGAGACTEVRFVNGSRRGRSAGRWRAGEARHVRGRHVEDVDRAPDTRHGPQPVVPRPQAPPDAEHAVTRVGNAVRIAGQEVRADRAASWRRLHRRERVFDAVDVWIRVPELGEGGVLF